MRQVLCQSSARRNSYRSRYGTNWTRVAPVKATKHKANPATDEVRMDNQTMVLPDHKVAITE